MEFGLLGPVVARHAGRSVAVGGGRERFVLAVLLLDAGRLTTTERLVDALWGDAPPSTARAQLHNLISKVRRGLRDGGGDLIRTHATGYECRLGEPLRALPLVRRALEIRRAQDTPRLTAQNLIIHAYTLIDAGRLDEASAALDEAEPITRALGDELHTTYVEQTRADIDIRCGAWQRAADRLARAARRFDQLGNRDGLAEVRRAQGELAVARGRPAAAVEPLTGALRIWRHLHVPLDEARLLAWLARAHQATGDPATAARHRAACAAILAGLSLPESCLRLD